MPRYIDANALDPFDYSIFDGQLSKDAIQGMETVLGCIDKIPTADVQKVKHGTWGFRQMDGFSDHWYQCDVCASNTMRKTAYCPYCGARMDGEKNDLRTS